MYNTPVVIRNSKPLTVSRSNVNVDRTEIDVLLMAFVIESKMFVIKSKMYSFKGDNCGNNLITHKNIK